MSASPSGAGAGTASQPAFSATIVACTAARVVRAAQPRQITSSRRPCRSTTARLPARWWRPSTFCVTSSDSVPNASQSANARCAALGAADEKRAQPAHARAQ
jgi:hypothetical protein